MRSSHQVKIWIFASSSECHIKNFVSSFDIITKLDISRCGGMVYAYGSGPYGLKTSVEVQALSSAPGAGGGMVYT